MFLVLGVMAVADGNYMNSGGKHTGSKLTAKTNQHIEQWIVFTFPHGLVQSSVPGALGGDA